MQRTAHRLLLASLPLWWAATACHASILSGQIRISNARPNGFTLNISLTPGNPKGTLMAYTLAEKRPSGSGIFAFERALQCTAALPTAIGNLYVVQAGQVLNDQTLRSGDPEIVIVDMHQPVSATLSPWIRGMGHDFWLAFGLQANGATPGDGGALTRFGWAHLRYNFLGIAQLIDSAMTFDEPGLMVGQKTTCGLCASATP